MNSLNSVLIEGNLVADPSFRITAAGAKVTNFSVGVNRYYKNASMGIVPEVSFFEIECWNKLAEQCSNNLAKGQGVRVVGRLKQNRWTDLEGNHHSKIIVVAEAIEYKPKTKEPADEQP